MESPRPRSRGPLTESGADREAGELLAVLGIEPDSERPPDERRSLRFKARMMAAMLRAAAAVSILRKRS